MANNGVPNGNGVAFPPPTMSMDNTGMADVRRYSNNPAFELSADKMDRRRTTDKISKA